MEDFSWFVSIGVVAVPALISAIVSIFNREARTPRPIRNITQLVSARSEAPVGSDSERALDALLAEYVRAVKPDLVNVRKLNWANVVLTLLFVSLTVFAMYGLSQWVSASASGGAVSNAFAWIVTVFVGVVLFAFNAAAIGTIYNPPISKEERERARAAKREAKREVKKN